MTTPTHALSLDSPIGTLVLGAREDVLARVWLANETPPVGVSALATSRVLDNAARQLAEYFAGRRRSFDLAVSTAGTQFQRSVWDQLSLIGYGETITYAELAARVSRPRAYRAVGQANGANPLPIVVPCHRVTASTGLGGYAGGLDVKRALLALEGVDVGTD